MPGKKRTRARPLTAEQVAASMPAQPNFSPSSQSFHAAIVNSGERIFSYMFSAAGHVKEATLLIDKLDPKKGGRVEIVLLRDGETITRSLPAVEGETRLTQLGAVKADDRVIGTLLGAIGTDVWFSFTHNIQVG